MKGIIAPFALIACFALLLNAMAVSNEITNGMNDVKNTIILGQRTSERQYEMQRDFENAVLSTKTMLLNARSDADRSIILCSSIETLKTKYSVEQGCINKGNYEMDAVKTNGIILKDAVRDLISEDYIGLFEALSPCAKFIRYEKETGEIIVGLNTQLDYENSVVNCDAAFVMTSNVSNHAVKNVVPAGTVIE